MLDRNRLWRLGRERWAGERARPRAWGCSGAPPWERSPPLARDAEMQVHLPHHPLDIMTLMRIDCATIRFHWPVALVVKRYWRSEGLNRHRISRLRVRRMRALAPACWPLEPPSRSHLEGLGLQV